MRRRNPWVLLAAAWIPAVVFLSINVAALTWLKGNTVGREAQLADQVDVLRAELVELEITGREAQSQTDRVQSIDLGLEVLDKKVFGDLALRLPAILRAIGDACAEAGLRPDRYGYSATDARDTDLIRFSIGFNLEGNYGQLRRLMAELQASDQMLSVTRVSFSGEEAFEGPELHLQLQVETYFNEADPATIRELLAGTSTQTAVEEEPAAEPETLTQDGPGAAPEMLPEDGPGEPDSGPGDLDGGPNGLEEAKNG